MPLISLRSFKGPARFCVWAAALVLACHAGPAWSQDDPDQAARKLARITGLMQSESFQAAPPSLLQRAGNEELLAELKRRNLDVSFLSPEQPMARQFYAASQRYPQLCADGTLLSACVQGMAQAMHDPYAAYLNPHAYTGLLGRMGGKEMAGPGVAVVKDHPGQPLEVLESARGSAAAEARLEAGDHIIEIDGCSTSDLAIDDARGRLQGEAGTQVTVIVSRAHPHSAQPEHLTLRRSLADGRTVTAHLLSDKQLKVGYVRIRSFGAQTATELREALENITREGATSLVLDLRNNGGGLVQAAVDVCSSFLPEGSQVVSVNHRTQTENFQARPCLRPHLPLAVLINHNSASSAEITAGAIRDTGVGILVGSRSFGKGTVQRFIPLSDGSALKLTTAHYRTPCGKEIHGVGIVPDVVDEEPVSTLGDADDLQLARAVAVLAQRPSAVLSSGFRAAGPLGP